MLAARSCFLSILLVHAAGQGLRGPQQAKREVVDAESVEEALLAELTNNVHGGALSKRVTKFEDSLRPMYTAVPKEAGGFLGHTLVRYMLHRYFVQMHGWFIRGLEPNSAQNAPQGGNRTLNNLVEWVPSYLQDFLEKLQGGRGISLRELAILAATLEDLIHKESVQRLEQTFNALELPQTELLDEAKLRQALEVYMMIYMLGGNFTVKGEKGVLRAHGIFTEKVKGWDAAQKWMHNVQVEVAPVKANEAMNFSVATKVVEEIGRRYGTYNDDECNSLKSEILQIESTKAGRVRLAEFYKKGLSGVFEFNEKIEYLRTLGTLDESNASDPLVIVPNYVAARPNCLVASGFYVVCCRNECEDLLGSLEKKFQSPKVKAQDILEHVAHLPSATVEAPRKLSDLLVQRLHSIADANEGQVHLHGRLFAQWMHHAFPRECPYPQQSGTVSPQTPDEWMEATGQQDSRKTKEELQLIVDNDGNCHSLKGPAARAQHDSQENALPWDEVEELPSDTDGVETIVEVIAREPQRSMFRTAAPMLSLATFLVGMIVCGWKVAAQGQDLKHGPASTVRQLVNRVMPGSRSTDELPCAQNPAHYVYF